MRIWLVNRFYWPDQPATAQLLGDLAERLAARGHEVHVLAGRPAGPAAPGTRSGVSIHRIPTGPLRGISLPAKASAFACFLLGALLILCLRLRAGDRVVTLTDPPLLGLVGRIACALRRARLFHWVQDIHPEVSLKVLQSRPLALLLRALVPLRNLSWRGSAGCVAPSPSMVARVRAITRNSPPVALLHNWAPAGLAPVDAAAIVAERKAWDLPAGAFVLMYSGNLGRVHDMESIARLLCLLRDLPSVLLVVVGRGPGLPLLEAACARLGVSDRVRTLPPRPRENLSASLAVADLHLVTLLPGCEELVFPSKVYGIAAVARPLVAIAPDDSDLTLLVRKHGLGLAASEEHLEGLASQIRALVPDSSQLRELQQAGPRLLAHTGDADSATLFWESLLASGPVPPPSSAR